MADASPEGGQPTGRWIFHLVASSEKLCQKWSKLLPMATVTLESGNEWPHGVATSGDEVFEMFGRLGRTPAWVIVDGGALHHSTVLMFQHRNLKKWGVRGAVSVWGQKIDEDEALLRHGTLEGMGVALDKVMQRGMAKAYGSVGAGRFKEGATAEDFREDKVQATLCAYPRSMWGEENDSASWSFQRKWKWPEEPRPGKGGDRLAENDGRLTGIEVPEVVGVSEMKERQDDRKLWIQEGQTFQGAFLPAAWKKILRFENDNRQANDAAAEATANGKVKRFGHVEDLIVPQSELRPGARGSL